MHVFTAGSIDILRNYLKSGYWSFLATELPVNAHRMHITRSIYAPIGNFHFPSLLITSISYLLCRRGMMDIISTFA